jgi:thioredoxin 1
MTLFQTGCGADPQPTDSKPAAVLTPAAQTTAPTVTPATATESQTNAKPKMLEFGSKQCQACKAMEPVMTNLKGSHSEIFDIDFIDVWIPANQMFAKSYNIQSIPTQVFLDANGKEVFRHTGFFSEEEILAKWREVGVDVDADKSATTTDH